MLNALAYLIAAPTLLATIVFALEVTMGARPAVTPVAAPMAGKVTIVVPAHNEANGLTAILQELKANAEGASIIVVADNCSDETAALARAAAVRVVERHDARRRGKGYALAFARAALRSDPPTAVVLIDADTVPAPGAVSRLAARASEVCGPVQAAYYLVSGTADVDEVGFSRIAFYLKNVIRQLGAQRLGGAASLTGSGIAMRWSTFEMLPLESGHLAEDMMLGLEALLLKCPPIFEPVAVTGDVSSRSGTESQRKRWETGSSQVRRSHLMPLLRDGLAHGHWNSLWAALQLLTPPFVPLLALDLIILALLAGGALAGLAIGPALLLGLVTLWAIIAVLIALRRHQQSPPLRTIVRIPAYLVWKIALSLRTKLQGEREWIRTDRS